MITDVIPLVDQLVPGLLQGGRRSVACVCTTRPKYLVFDGDPTRPACVVEFGDALRLTRADRILSELGSRMPPGGVPGSLCCRSWQNGTYVHIQQGLPGVPWFRVADALQTAQAWRSLLDRAVTTMLALHAATQEVPAWTGTVYLNAELDRQVALCREHGTPLSDAVLARVHDWSAALRATGPLRAYWQHGDFSLNNLLVSADSMAVIDFEEFGGTLVPLHDAFGLALSFPLSQDTRCRLSRNECIRACVAGARAEEGIEAVHLPALLMHHLLWRVNQCEGLERRAALRTILLGWIEELAGDRSADVSSFFAA